VANAEITGDLGFRLTGGYPILQVGNLFDTQLFFAASVSSDHISDFPDRTARLPCRNSPARIFKQ
jgi:hypothetical protein